MLATSTVLRSPPKPSWQTDELEDEWIEPSSSHDHDSDDDVSQPHSLSIISNGRFDDVAPKDPMLSPHISPASPTPPGTFLVREDQLAAPIMPKQLQKGKSKSLLKDFFSPLALETMFEPPSPRRGRSNTPLVPPQPDDVTRNVDEVHNQEAGVENSLDGELGEDDMEEETRPFPNVEPEGNQNGEQGGFEGEDVILASDIPNLMSFDGRKPSSSYKFTFSAAPPRALTAVPHHTPQSSPLPVKNTPLSRLQPPPTDPRLRLFQFQYDTFTRDHLSAMVDSIAVHTPSSDSNKSKSPANVLSRGNTYNRPSSTPEAPNGYLRATKRLKLTPPEDLSHGARTLGSKSRKDYVGESKNLMRMIKQARTPSMMTTLSVRENIQPTNVEDHSTVEDRPRRVPLGDLRSMWSSDTPSEASCSQQDPNHSPTPSSSLQPSSAHISTSIHPVYPTSTLTPSIPSSLFSSTSNSDSKPSSIASALGYRRQAADLMAQIRKDMTTGKRLISLETVKDKTFDEADHLEPSNPLHVSVTPASPRGGYTLQPSSSQIPSSSPHFPAPSNPPLADTEKQKPAAVRKVPKPSPRKLLRRLSAADEVDREIAMNQSNPDASLSVLPAGESRDGQFMEQSTDVNYFSRTSTTSSQRPSQSPTDHQPQSIQVFHVSAHVSSSAKTDFLLPQAPSMSSGSGRVVSSGTASSLETADSVLTRGTTATSTTSVITGRTASTQSAASAASFVKHAGPVQITRIGPEDVPSLPELVGGMRFDRQLMRWVKTGPTETGQRDDGVLAGHSEESEDPFRSFESLESGRVEEAGDAADTQLPAERGEEGPDVDNADEEHESRVDRLAAAVTTMTLQGDETDDSFDFEYHSGEAVVEVMTGIDSHDTDIDTETTDSEEDELRSEEGMAEIPSEQEDDATATIPARDPVVTIPPNPVTMPGSYSTPTPAHRTGLAPPRSVLKNGNGSLTPGSTIRTPNKVFSSAHRRSVSFSDGRKDGKIKGLGRDVGGETQVPEPDCIFPVVTSAGTTPFVLSARGSRIAAILEGLAEAEPSFEEQTPSKASTSSRPLTGAIQAFSSRGQSDTSSRRPFTRSGKEQELSLAQGNQTLLTECSFGVAHDKLVHVITDVHPYVPHWDTLGHINLSKKGIESVARLKEFLPKLDALNLEENTLLWLTGVPKTIRTLSVASNLLTAMTSFNHLVNLENLDVSNNQIDSLRQLSCLRHLRELKADGNAITSLDGLGELDSLTRLSLRDNSIKEVDFGELRWPRLELLNLSRNGLRKIAGLSTLSSLAALNLDHNSLVSLEVDGPMPRLRTLRISNNRLARLNASRFTNVRTLYADNNRLCGVDGAPKLGKLENLSLRNQGGKGLTLATNEIRDVKRLYLSGNPLPSTFLSEPCYNLVYLEVAACRLTQLPRDLARLTPNVRVLNLNYNFLTDARGLEGLARLRKLTLIGSRLKGTKPLVRMLRRMPDIEMLDFRMNPCTLGWYLPILVRDVPGALQPSEAARPGGETKRELREEDRPDARDRGGGGGGGGAYAGRRHGTNENGGGGHSWAELDAKFRRDLPDEAYVGRLAYRGLVMRACPQVRMLDGVVVEGREREKAERLLQGLLRAKRREGT